MRLSGLGLGGSEGRSARDLLVSVFFSFSFSFFLFESRLKLSLETKKTDVRFVFLSNVNPGRVKLAKHSQTGQYAAIKIVPKHAILSSRLSISEAGAKADKVLLGIEREIVIMKLIDHPNVMNLYDVWETNGEL